MPLLRSLLAKGFESALNVVELGAGCGIVGIALAQMIPNCAVCLTDMAEAQTMLQKNKSEAHLAQGSSLSRKLLEWGSLPPHKLPVNKVDLVLISDCTYNADSCPELVRTLSSLVQHSPEAMVLVAVKRRHDSEAFFDYLMDRAHFQTIEFATYALSHEESDLDSSAPTIEMYLYDHVKTSEP